MRTLRDRRPFVCIKDGEEFIKIACRKKQCLNNRCNKMVNYSNLVYQYDMMYIWLKSSEN